MKDGEGLVSSDKAISAEGSEALNEALLSGEDLVSPRVKAERALTAQLDKAASVMQSLLAMKPVDKFEPSDSGEPNCVERINTGMAQLQWKIAQYILDAAMDRLPTPIANTGRSIVVKTIDAKQLQHELAKRLKKAA